MLPFAHRHRRLVAILYADVVDFSRHVGNDEVATQDTLFESRDIIAKLARGHRGRVLQHAGDSLVAEFPTATYALACALVIHETIPTLDSGMTTDGRWRLRIGIHVGEVHVRGTDVFGDSVNVTARLESLADPGGVCVSESVRQAVGSKLPVNYRFLGERTVKNIKEPVRPYHVDLRGDAGDVRLHSPAYAPIRQPLWLGIVGTLMLTAAVGLYWPDRFEPASTIGQATSVDARNRPSIAVLPFDNLSDDAEQAHFSDGLTNDIITDLSRFSDLLVIAANSTFRYKGVPTRVQDIADDLQVRYVLEGSVQRSVDQVRINAQLIDAATGHHLWADKFDQTADNFFAVQNEISRRIVGVIGPIGRARGKLRAHELNRLAQSPTESLRAYDHYLKGVALMDQGSTDSSERARNAFEKAVALDPHYAKALAGLAWTYLDDFRDFRNSDTETSKQLAISTAQLAVEADVNEPDAHEVKGAIALYLNRHDDCLRHLRKAVELNPNGVDPLMYLGWSLSYAGKPLQGLRIMEKAILRNPFHPDWYLYDIGWANFVAGRYDEAIEVLEKRTHPSNYTHLLLAINYAKTGQTEKSAESLGLFEAAEPYYSIETAARANPFKREVDLQHYLQGLQEAGLRKTSPTRS